VDEVLRANAKQVEDYRAGKEKGLQLAGRAGDESHQGKGRSGPGERDPAAQAWPADPRRYLVLPFIISSAKRFLSSSYLALMTYTSRRFAARRSSCAFRSISEFLMSAASLAGGAALPDFLSA
jgi:hypothetical protein